MDDDDIPAEDTTDDDIPAEDTTDDDIPAEDMTDDDIRDVSARRRRIDRSDGRMRAFRLAYDGRPFRGFQRQPDVYTVEDALFDALRALDVFDPDDTPADRPNRPPGYAAAGRTDAGVSALAQTVAFACPDWLTPRALDAELPASVRTWASADVAPDFHATHDAVRREYTYYLHAPRASGDDTGLTRDGDTVPRGIDDERVRTALSTLRGRHDFHNLTTEEEGTVRDLTATVDREGEFLAIRAASDGFPREFVRRLVTLLHRVGAGDADLMLVDRVLDAKPLSGAAGVGPAPPEPLVLSAVVYPDCEFERDPDAADSAARVFGARRSEALAAARVMSALQAGSTADERH